MYLDLETIRNNQDYLKIFMQVNLRQDIASNTKSYNLVFIPG